VFRYPGGKDKLSDVIISKIISLSNGKDTYIEPFFGGGSIGLKILTDKIFKNIRINDKDIGIACLWTAIIKYPELLKKHVMSFTPSIKHFYSYKEDLLCLTQVSDNDESIAICGFKKLAIHQISYSGLGTMSGGPLGGKKQVSKYKIDCRWSPVHICKKIDQLHSKFMKCNVEKNTCSSKDFEEILKDNKDRYFYYLDPPYYIKGNSLYQCGFNFADHTRLANILKNIKGAWLLSYDDCEEIKKLYCWAKIEEVNINYTIRGSRNKKELLIYAS